MSSWWSLVRSGPARLRSLGSAGEALLLLQVFLLRRAGLEVTLCFGMARLEDGGFAGHCWLVNDGAPYLEAHDPQPRFATIYAFVPQSS